MPTYEYACKSCGEHLEIVQSFKDDPITECPACGGQLRKVFGNIGIAFKGSGFYRTDSRSDGHKAKAGSSASREGGSANVSSGTSEAKKDAVNSKSEGSAGSSSGSGSSGTGSSSGSGSGSSSGGSSSVAAAS